MHVIIAASRVPFAAGAGAAAGGGESGATEAGVAQLLGSALRAAGHAAAIVIVPRAVTDPDAVEASILETRLLELAAWCGGTTDRLICLDRGAAILRHPAKTLWLQSDTAAEADEEALLASPGGRHARSCLLRAERLGAREAGSRYAACPHALHAFAARTGLPIARLARPSGPGWARAVAALLDESLFRSRAFTSPAPALA